jgi:hypothetical protein
MTTPTVPRPERPGLRARIWRALRAFDESLHDDPAEALQRRIDRLEARLHDAEPVPKGAHSAHPTRRRAL